MITFLFFAQLMDDAGRQSMQLEFSEGQSLQDYLTQLVGILPRLQAALLEDDSVLVSVNQKLARRSDILSSGDEVGLLPPFSGG